MTTVLWYLIDVMLNLHQQTQHCNFSITHDVFEMRAALLLITVSVSRQDVNTRVCVSDRRWRAAQVMKVNTRTDRPDLSQTWCRYAVAFSRWRAGGQTWAFHSLDLCNQQTWAPIFQGGVETVACFKECTPGVRASCEHLNK